MVECSGKGSCQSARVDGDCACACDHANHGMRRLEFAEYRAIGAVGRSPEVEEAAANFQRQYDDAVSTQRRRIAQKEKERDRGWLPKLTFKDCNSATEYARTVDIVDWLVLEHAPRRQMLDLKGEISVIAGEVADKLGNDRSKRRRIADHVWCDLVASLVVAVEELSKLGISIEELLADKVAENLTAITWEGVKRSRGQSYGLRPNRRTDSIADPRRARDRRAGVSDEVLRYATQRVVSAALKTLVSADTSTTFATLLLKLRIIALLLCPDPSAHKLVWDHCLVPLLGGELASRPQQQLCDLISELRKPAGWDRPVSG